MPTATTAEKIKRLKKFLDKQFPDVTTALKFKTPLQLLVATILAAQCTDTLVNKITENLFKKYKTTEDFANANLETLKKDIYPVTFYNNKAAALIKMAKILVAQHKGAVPKTMEQLLELPGVARKTANVVLGHAYGIASGFVVDTHVKRVSNRFGFTNSSDPKKIEQGMIKLVPQKDWIKFADQMIWFGRKICAARFNKCNLYPEIKDLCKQ